MSSLFSLLLRTTARVPLAGCAAAWVASGGSDGYTHAEAPSGKPSVEERIVGNYENRLRNHSNPQRLFEYFASVQQGKEFFMTREDFARLLTPYTSRQDETVGSKNYKYNFKAWAQRPSEREVERYSKLLESVLAHESGDEKIFRGLLKELQESRVDFQTHLKLLRQFGLNNRLFEEHVQRNGGPEFTPSVFDLIDGDGDGLISYPEYMFFNTILSFPEKMFEVAFKLFDEDGNSEIDYREFKKIIDTMRMRTPAGRQDKQLSLKLNTGEDPVPIFPYFFGEDGHKTLSYESFRSFRRQIKEEVVKIQFNQYDIDGSKELSSKEFGLFLISCANQMEMKKWVDRAGRLDSFEGTISETEFLSFVEFLEYLDELKIAMELVDEQGLNKEQFLRATRAATKGTKQLVTEAQVDVIFHLFDEDGNGILGVHEFVSVMEKRRSDGRQERRDLGVMDFIGAFMKCVQE